MLAGVVCATDDPRGRIRRAIETPTESSFTVEGMDAVPNTKHVNFITLTVKLSQQSAGVRGNALNWFRNFLLDRRQWTIIGQSVSALEYLHAGVPQGAILSPLLFTLYVNDITASTCGDVNLFADDTSAFTVSDSAQNLQLSLQTVANDLSSWFKSWALTINVEKLPLWFFAPGKKFQPFLSLSMAVHVRSSKCVSRNILVLITSMNG